ncbi:unnamed protein product [Parascedosporium putredinis]|uniref:Endonuclease/exonuclease/phosphatase domain-containing protein n=1 Tax=Parascedosporium putredinis TaxID=1442378 RepID=A0A9P1M8K9_9PEZI|nr:unnamed protein product [Parascedosporium putredinis]CAI7993739.1 unnamed protein product [Parascedosporium putredinis]
MEALISQAIQDSLRLRKTSVPWKDDEPHPQSYYAFDLTAASWVAKSPSKDVPPDAGEGVISNLKLYSWNIDFMLPFAEARMKPALAHLGNLVGSHTQDDMSIIFLQECMPSDLKTIASTPWVRERFHLTDLDTTNWATTHYGTVTLVDVRLPISAVFRVHYSKTRMDRDVLFTDVSVGETIRSVSATRTLTRWPSAHHSAQIRCSP